MSLALYYAPGACSIVAHIALEEAQASFHARRILTNEGQQRSADYLALNPHGKVPLLLVDEKPLTELSAILTYLGGSYGMAGSIPQDDLVSAVRTYQLLSWCSFTVHIAFAHVFRPERFAPEAVSEDVRSMAMLALDSHFQEIDTLLAGRHWLVDDMFTGADSYIFAFYRWARRIGVDVAKHQNWTVHTVRLLERDAARRAIETEGLSASEWIAS